MSHLGRILVVDDEPRWLDPLRHVLTSAGYDVRAVNGGEPALASVEDGLPDLILLDIRMPGMDGFEVLRRFKAREDTRDIPILLISAFAEVDERIEGLKLGAVDSVTKPFHAGELLARVRMQVELSRLRVQHTGQTAALKSINGQLESEIARRQQVEEALQTRVLALTQPLDSPAEIRFSDLFDPEEIQQLQDLFSDATGVASIITGPDGIPITRPSNFCRLCSEIIRKTGTGLSNCHKSDAVLGFPCSSGPIVQPCLSGGLWDAGASITVGGKHIANWLIGQVRNEGQDEEQMLRYADEIGADREAFRKALAEVPVMSLERFEQTAQALFAFARQISSRAYQNVQQARFITERQAAEARIARLTQLYAALSHCSQAIVRSSSMEELFPKICKGAVEFGGLRMAWIGLVDEASGALCPVASHGEGTDYLKEIKASTDAREARGRGPTGTSIRENRPVWCQDFQNDPTTAPWREPGARFGWRAAASLPLRRGGKSIGALVVYSDKPDVFDEESRELLEEMAADVSFALDSLDNEAEHKKAEEALRDLNRHLEGETARAAELAVEAQAAARAKSEFLALMSHELRTPLNGVLGFAELLSRTRLDVEQQEFTKTILGSGTHLLDLVNDILDFSSIEKGRMPIESAPISLASLVESSCRTIQKAAADKGLEFSCVTAADVPEEIMGDARRIRQILINLLGNAIKFTRRGSVVLEVSPATLEDGPALDFSVEDTGPGIATETVGYLFKPFTQADTTVSREFEGTGLGLAISLRLAEAMGGTLGVVSTPGEGSRFTFRLPLRDGARAAAKSGNSDPSSGPEKPGRAVPVPLSGHPVLVVEDDSSSRILAGKMLAILGCRAEFATNGQEAVDAFAPEEFSAILMDMQMPVMDGVEATRKIRESESGTRVPIIAFTANVMEADRERCLAAGMDAVLTKPFKMAELSAMLARFLRP